MPIGSTSIGRSTSTCRSGIGAHFCIGAALARMEARVALEETLRRFPVLNVDRDGAVNVHTSTVRGYSKIPVAV